MNDIAALSGYFAIGVALLLLVAAGLMQRRAGQSVASLLPFRARGAASRGAVILDGAEHDTPESVATQTASATRSRRQLRPDDGRLLEVTVECTGLAMVAVSLAGWLWGAPGDLWAFWLLLAVGAGVAVLARIGLGWPRRDPDPTVEASSEATTAAQPGVQRLGILTLAGPWGGFELSWPLVNLVLLAEAGSLALFNIGRLLSVAWLLHLLAVGALVVTLGRTLPRSERQLVGDWSRRDWVWLLALVLAALAVRVWNLGSIPEGLWYDESQRGLEALRMLAERGYRPIFAAAILQEPTGLWYLMMPLVALLGRDPVALRLPVAVAGAVGVGAVYLLARVLYGQRVALVAAGFAVALTWHLNFSRVALPAVVSLTCDTLAAVAFMAGLRRESRFLLALAGVLCSAGLYFYFTSQLMPFVLGVVALHHLVVKRNVLARRVVAGLALCALCYVLTAGPFVFYAVSSPWQFAARANAVTVMRDVENAHSFAPVWANVRAHLLMFQVHGDNNGRHNWSGHPMLDPVTGGLSVLGLGLALTRLWRPEQVLLLAWLPIAMAGGILSSIWDAPQSHRSIDALIPAVILAALPLGLLWQSADRVVTRALTSRVGRAGASQRGLRVMSVRMAWLAPVLVVAVVVGTDLTNLDRFFRLQQTDEKSWVGFMAPQTVAARQMAALPSDVRVYLEPNYVRHPSIDFVDGGRHEIGPYDPGASLPVVAPSAAIFIADRPGAAEQIARTYPAAQRTYSWTPAGDKVVGYGFVLPPEVIQSTRGVMAHYQGAAGTTEQRERSLAFDWPTGAPMAAPFSATWTATLSAPTYGTYRLRLEGPPSLVLLLDGNEVVRGGGEGSVRLARGSHALRLSGTDLGSAPVRLTWGPPNADVGPIPESQLNSAPVETEGLLGRVYAGAAVTGEPVLEQVDPNVELRAHFLPSPRPYTLVWTGAVRAERAGRYRFGLTSLGASALVVDGTEVVRKDVGEAQPEGEIELSTGWHDISIRFVDTVDYSYITALWQPPGADRQPIPPAALRPWPAARVAAARPEDALSP